MNVPFFLRRRAAERRHSSPGRRRAAWRSSRATAAVGGMRASIYNAMPVAGVAALVAYMQDFEAANG